MTYHKIRGVDKSTCTAEQKIAYNMAWRIRMDCRYSLDAPDVSGWPASHLAAVLANAIRAYTTQYMEQGGKYDVDAIFCALNAGLKSYILGKYHILTSYQEIGKAFPALYMEG